MLTESGYIPDAFSKVRKAEQGQSTLRFSALFHLPILITWSKCHSHTPLADRTGCLRVHGQQKHYLHKLNTCKHRHMDKQQWSLLHTLVSFQPPSSQFLVRTTINAVPQFLESVIFS